MSKNSVSSVGAFGNTRKPPKVKQINTSKHWTFTLNNYKKCDIEEISVVCAGFSKCKYVFQEETGEEGTPHLQGYIDFGRRVRPTPLFKNKGYHFEHKKGTIKQNIDYCSKVDTRTGKIYSNFYEEIITINPGNFFFWQTKLLALLEKKPDNRKILWYWERKGAVGKTQFAKYLVVHKKALYLSGKASDCKMAIALYIKEHCCAPKIVIFDIPRVSLDYISFQALEEIKNGMFFSGKYESKMCVFNSPHVVCFANERPNKDKLSKDRWRIRKIK